LAGYFKSITHFCAMPFLTDNGLQMLVKSYQPKDPLLKKYIECIYTLRRTEDEETIRYIAFPSVFAMVCLNANCGVEVQGTNLIYSASPDYPLQTKLICDYSDASWIRYEGATDEIVIYFKPLGIGAFLEKPLSHYTNSVIADFDPYEDFRDSIMNVFAFDGDDARIKALEKYLLSKFSGFDHPFLNGFVDEMFADAGTFSITDAAERYNISRTTLNKHFGLHIGTTPSQFRKIIRFRDAMKRHRQSIDGQNLTNISHGAEYFDQSHMIKDFKALTKYSPKAFFSRLSTLEDGQINWLFLPPA
jgi:AraC-like DNA-binding protein